jgi:hypothetical protein
MDSPAAIAIERMVSRVQITFFGGCPVIGAVSYFPFGLRGSTVSATDSMADADEVCAIHVSPSLLRTATPTAIHIPTLHWVWAVVFGREGSGGTRAVRMVAVQMVAVQVLGLMVL